MEIHPVKTEADYESALEEIDRLWGSPEGSADGDRLDVLLILVEDYEAKHHAIDLPDPIEAIKFRMEQMNLTRKDLEPIIGSRGRVSEVFNRRRSLFLRRYCPRSTHVTYGAWIETFVFVACC